MNLLVTGAWGAAWEHIPELERRGHTVAFMQYEKDALPCPCDWVEGVICNGLFLHHPIESFSRLRFIQLTSAGSTKHPRSRPAHSNTPIATPSATQPV